MPFSLRTGTATVHLVYTIVVRTVVYARTNPFLLFHQIVHRWHGRGMHHHRRGEMQTAGLRTSQQWLSRAAIMIWLLPPHNPNVAAWNPCLPSLMHTVAALGGENRNFFPVCLINIVDEYAHCKLSTDVFLIQIIHRRIRTITPRRSRSSL